MAKTSIEIVRLIRTTAASIAASADYQWGHMGACNCGFLAQQITHMTKDEIHRKAMQSYGDWSEQLNDYCSTSGLPLDTLISAMLHVGFDTTDLKHLERLSDPEVLDTLPVSQRFFVYNRKSDVVKYLNAWANLLEAELIGAVSLKDLTLIPLPVTGSA